MNDKVHIKLKERVVLDCLHCAHSKIIDGLLYCMTDSECEAREIGYDASKIYTRENRGNKKHHNNSPYGISDTELEYGKRVRVLMDVTS